MNHPGAGSVGSTVLFTKAPGWTPSQGMCPSVQGSSRSGCGRQPTMFLTSMFTSLSLPLLSSLSLKSTLKTILKIKS